jgi:hypothetical protein
VAVDRLTRTNPTGGMPVPALPWASSRTAEPGREYLVLASALPLRRFWATPGFVRMALQVRRQLAGAPRLGRVTYLHFAAAWPSIPDDKGFSDRINSLPAGQVLLLQGSASLPTRCGDTTSPTSPCTGGPS